jgi:uncharacterized protein YfbU (UPF0304 family)
MNYSSIQLLSKEIINYLRKEHMPTNGLSNNIRINQRQKYDLLKICKNEREKHENKIEDFLKSAYLLEESDIPVDLKDINEQNPIIIITIINIIKQYESLIEKLST